MPVPPGPTNSTPEEESAPGRRRFFETVERLPEHEAEHRRMYATVGPEVVATLAGRETTPAPPALVPWREFLAVWGRVAALSFGGPAGQIAVMHRLIVDERRWVCDERFLHALNYCMLLPGPEAQQLATYLGWLMRGVAGGLVAGLLFVLPGFICILALSLLYTCYGESSLVEGLFYGLKPAVLALVADAVWRIGKRSLRSPSTRAIAAASFVAAFFFAAPFPAVVVVAALVGFVGGTLVPEQFRTGGKHGAAAGPVAGDFEPYSLPGAAVPPTLARSLLVLTLGLTIWWGPIAAIAARRGADDVLTQQALLFSKAAVLTFGGAYSVLGYVADQAVKVHGWLEPAEMLDGLAMAESTPGPLIQVVQFVGYLASYRNPGELSPVAAGIVGSVVTTWATFAPCFLWIFLGAPYVERLRDATRISAALTAITAAVVGVIASLGLWLTVHSLFAVTTRLELGPVALDVPVWGTLDPLAAAMAACAFVAIRGVGVSVLPVLGCCAAIGWFATAFN